MRVRNLFSLFLLLILVLSCSKDYPVANNQDITDNNCSSLALWSPNDTTDYQFDPFRIVSANMEGDYLKLTVTYGGGCQNHYFVLVWNQLSMTPFDDVILYHDNHGDMCKALITQKLCYNMKLLRGNSTSGDIKFPLTDPYGHTFWIDYNY